MSEKYKIIDVTKYESNDGDGFVVVVLANPVNTTSLGHMFVSEGKNINTEEFVFADEKRITEPIIRIARSETIWTPCPDDFEDMEDEEGKTVHIHMSLLDADSDEYDMTMNSGNRTVNVPGAHYKADQLRNQWVSNGWMYEYTLREYVHSLATGDDVQNFWGWLFDDSSLNGCSMWDLPQEYHEAYQRFLNMFGD